VDAQKVRLGGVFFVLLLLVVAHPQQRRCLPRALLSPRRCRLKWPTPGPGRLRVRPVPRHWARCGPGPTRFRPVRHVVVSWQKKFP
jgi:hypothetical protein